MVSKVNNDNFWLFLLVASCAVFLLLGIAIGNLTNKEEPLPVNKATFADTETIIVEGEYGPYECILSKSKQGVSQTCFHVSE